MMKKIWKVVLIIAVTVCIVGIVCAATAYFMGGTLDSLYQNKSALPVLEMLSPTNIINSIAAFFGA